MASEARRTNGLPTWSLTAQPFEQHHSSGTRCRARARHSSGTRSQQRHQVQGKSEATCCSVSMTTGAVCAHACARARPDHTQAMKRQSRSARRGKGGRLQAPLSSLARRRTRILHLSAPRRTRARTTSHACKPCLTARKPVFWRGRRRSGVIRPPSPVGASAASVGLEVALGKAARRAHHMQYGRCCLAC